MATSRMPKLRLSPDGVEKLCPRCDEWWPADLEFFFADPKGAGGLYLYCKACFAEHVRPAVSRRVIPPPAPMFSLTALAAAWSQA